MSDLFRIVRFKEYLLSPKKNAERQHVTINKPKFYFYKTFTEIILKQFQYLIPFEPFEVDKHINKTAEHYIF